MIEKKDVQGRLKIWLSLLDASMYFALAGMKFKGYSYNESLAKIRRRWIRGFKEHMQANLEIIHKLYGYADKRK